MPLEPVIYKEGTKEEERSATTTDSEKTYDLCGEAVRVIFDNTDKHNTAHKLLSSVQRGGRTQDATP